MKYNSNSVSVKNRYDILCKYFASNLNLQMSETSKKKLFEVAVSRDEKQVEYEFKWFSNVFSAKCKG